MMVFDTLMKIISWIFTIAKIIVTAVEMLMASTVT